MRTVWLWMLPLAAAMMLAGCKREPKASAGSNAPTVARPMRVGPPTTQEVEHEDRAKLLEGFYDLAPLGEGVATAVEGEMWVKYKNGMMIHELRHDEGVQAFLGMTVRVTYVGTIPGTNRVFDRRAASNPLVFRLGSKEMIKGFSLALLELRAGCKRRVYVPADLAYGEQGKPELGIGPNQPLIYEMELLDVGGEAINITLGDLPKFEPMGPPAPATTSAPGTEPK